MESTRLNLLTRDGALVVIFTPALEPDHYTELHELIQGCDTVAELRKAIVYAASNWEREVIFD